MKPVKCVVWDLDNTLWDGILLENDKLSLKPGVVEILNTLDKRGILLSIVSKNNYEDVIQVLEKFSIRKLFLYPQVGWDAKSIYIENIKKLLNISLDTILFIDDLEFERDEVNSCFPEVETLDALQYKDLLSMPRLIPRIITEDSGRRRMMYQEDEKRKLDEASYIGNRLEFLKQLNMKLTISLATKRDLMRMEELIIRTNQLNSTGIQYTYSQLEEMLLSPDFDIWICELDDKYGAYGKIGLAVIEKHDNKWCIKLLLMSCRTVSHGIGSIVLSYIMNLANKEGKILYADFKRNDRNRQMLITYQLANFKMVSKDNDLILFENDLSIIQNYPDYINLVFQ